MQNSDQIKPIELSIERPGAIEEMDAEETALMDEYLNIIEEVRKLPDAEERLQRIRGTIQIRAGHPERSGLEAEAEPVKDEPRDYLQEFCDVVGEIEKRPDADDVLPLALRELKAIAREELRTRLDDETRARLAEKKEYRDGAIEAAHDLAAAFTTIIEHSEFIHRSHLSSLMDTMNNLIADSEWESDPEVLREVLPHILKASLWKNRPDHLT
jgi:hypothetical protein